LPCLSLPALPLPCPCLPLPCLAWRALPGLRSPACPACLAWLGVSSRAKHHPAYPSLKLPDLHLVAHANRVDISVALGLFRGMLRTREGTTE
jgi:hypothetical protein